MRKTSKSSYNAVGSGVTPKLGNKSTVSGLARPGQREAKSATAESMMSTAGKVARPGAPGGQKKAPGGKGRGTIARPGGPESISGRGVNK